MEISLAKILEASKFVSMVPEASGLASSQFMRIQASKGRVSLALTGVLTGTASVGGDKKDEEWCFFADRKLISRFLSSAGGKTLDLAFDPKGNSLLLKSGRAKLRLANKEKVAGYTKWSEADDKPVCKVEESWIPTLAFLSRYAAFGTGMQHLESVQSVSGFGLVATDSFALAFALSSKAVQYRVPAKVAELVEDVKGELTVTKNGALIRYGKNYLYQSSPSEIKKFPQQKILATWESLKASKVIFSASAKDLQAALRQLVAFSPEDILECVTGNNRLTLRAATTTISSDVSLPAEAKDGSKLRWSAKLILPWITQVAESAKQIVCSAGPEGQTILTAKCKYQKEKFDMVLITIDMGD